MKAILYKRPPNQQIMRLAGSIRSLCRQYDSQLFCQTGKEIGRLSDDCLSESLRDLTRIFCRPGIPKFFAVGQNADELIDALYKKLLTWDPPLPAQDTDDYGPELVITSSPNRVSKLVFRIKDESMTVSCQMLFNAPEPVEHSIRDEADAADPKRTASRLPAVLIASKTVEHIVLCRRQPCPRQAVHRRRRPRFYRAVLECRSLPESGRFLL